MKFTKKALIATGLAAITAAGVAGTAVALSLSASERMYIYTYYTDASKTQMAGATIDRCYGSYIVTQPSHVTPTPYFDREWIGMCPGYLF